ncbi:unnamed protein product, partial [Symbiodinium sp. CCMP2592]
MFTCSPTQTFQLSSSLALTTEADTSGVPSVPSCAKIGVAYSEDRDTARSLPNGAYLADAKMCQQLLGETWHADDLELFRWFSLHSQLMRQLNFKSMFFLSGTGMLDCTHFTWKEDSFPGGACYLFKQLGKEEPDAKAISGPKACVSSEDAKVAQDMPTLPPVAVITPTVKPIIVVVKRPLLHVPGCGFFVLQLRHPTGPKIYNYLDSTLGAAPAATGGGSNMMTTALAGGAVAAIGIGGVAYYFLAGGKKSKDAMIADEDMGFYQQVPAYQPATTAATYTYQYPGIQAGPEQLTRVVSEIGELAMIAQNHTSGLATHATGSLLDNFEWLKQHGDEALEAAAHCQDVVVQLSKLSEHCRVSNQLENFAAVVAWIAIEQTGEEGSSSFLADLARSPPALAMKEKAQKAILASTQASMDEACNPECALDHHHEFFEAFAGCYAPSVCAASGMGEVSFHRC